VHFQVTPRAFEEQLQHLHDAGYHSVALTEWIEAIKWKRPLPGLAVALAFADGYRDFAEHAWPLLERYGFTATVFLVTDRVGRSSNWDPSHSKEVPLLDWPEMRELAVKGITFGSHTASRRPLTALSFRDIVREAAHSRATLQRELGQPVTALTYPLGETDPAVQHLVGACGYTVALTRQRRRSRLHDDPLALPSFEVSGYDPMSVFVARLKPPTRK
jgi:peptidoglycan/xylan/chitin deacetylase (PgdA/CDA1 family)